MSALIELRPSTTYAAWARKVTEMQLPTHPILTRMAPTGSIIDFRPFLNNFLDIDLATTKFFLEGRPIDLAAGAGLKAEYIASGRSAEKIHLYIVGSWGLEKVSRKVTHRGWYQTEEITATMHIHSFNRPGVTVFVNETKIDLYEKLTTKYRGRLYNTLEEDGSAPVETIVRAINIAADFEKAPADIKDLLQVPVLARQLQTAVYNAGMSAGFFDLNPLDYLNYPSRLREYISSLHNQLNAGFGMGVVSNSGFYENRKTIEGLARQFEEFVKKAKYQAYRGRILWIMEHFERGRDVEVYVDSDGIESMRDVKRKIPQEVVDVVEVSGAEPEAEDAESGGDASTVKGDGEESDIVEEVEAGADYAAGVDSEAGGGSHDADESEVGDELDLDSSDSLEDEEESIIAEEDEETNSAAEDVREVDDSHENADEVNNTGGDDDDVGGSSSGSDADWDFVAERMDQVNLSTVDASDSSMSS